MRRLPVLPLLIAFVFSLFGASTVMAVDPELGVTPPLPAGAEGRRITDRTPVDVARPSVLSASLLSATGVRQVVVRLTSDSVGEVAATGAGAAAQRQAQDDVRAQQDSFIASADEATVIARTEIATNAVVVTVDAAQLQALAADPNVERISPVIDYRNDLEETVPYIGAEAVQTAGFTGAGIRVAVLDSGIDYTHAALGGLGTPAAYAAAYGTTTADPLNTLRSGLFPTARVVDGWDFVGETWPTGPLAPDEDPIDCGPPTIDCAGGHGTHVADIIGGTLGVAPEVDLLAIKVCSAISPSCSGVALLQGMDFALDPNGDGVTDDAVHVINMSLGSDYGGAHDDDLSTAVETAAALGVLTVASAGNGADHPYVSGTPAATPSALSVAQTQVPSAVLPLMEVTAPAALVGTYEAAHQTWSLPLTALVAGNIYFDPTTDLTRTGCRQPLLDGSFDPTATNPFTTDLTGLIVLIERGICTFSEKVANVALAGGEAAIIGLVTPEDPFSGALGDCPEDACTTIPGFMIRQDISEAMQAAEATGTVTVEFDPEAGLELVGQLASTSSRGPSMENLIKPEIGAPGASVSAIAGSATDTGAFGGTSGAAPMVTGSAALLMEALPDRTSSELKALLMNYAETEIFNTPPELGGELAPIQRIGAGEVRVDRSLEGSGAAAYDTTALTGALSFGFADVTDASTTLTRNVTVRNFSDTTKTFQISSTRRFADDIANAAVGVSAPSSIEVVGGGEATFDVTLTINGALLRDWTMDSGFNGNNAAIATLLEYDGYVELDDTSTAADDADPMHLAWHVFPRKSGDTTASSNTVDIDGTFPTAPLAGTPSGSVEVTNAGVGLTGIDGYSLLAESPNIPTGPQGAGLPIVDLRYAGVQTIPVPANFCSANPSFLLLLATTTWERQTHANAPAAFEWDIDTNADGTADYAIFNFELAGDLSDGRNVVLVQGLDPLVPAFPTFFTDHSTNSGNTVLTICAEDIGLTGEDFGTPLTADVLAVDWYFTGTVTDVIADLAFAPGGERYLPVVGADGFGGGDVAPGATEALHVLDFGATGTNPSEIGVLLLTDGARVNAADEFYKPGAPLENEAIGISVVPAGEETELPFDDIEDSPFVEDIVWLFDNGITVGCSIDPPLFCPLSNVSREQMATFLDRALDLPATTEDFFDDDNNSGHEDAINRLAAAGITEGCGPRAYCPRGNVLREQMASFLVRAYDLPPTTVDYFDDDDARPTHEADINALAESQITLGCGTRRFCPTNPVTREQMAAFLHRATP